MYDAQAPKPDAYDATIADIDQKNPGWGLPLVMILFFLAGPGANSCASNSNPSSLANAQAQSGSASAPQAVVQPAPQFPLPAPKSSIHLPELQQQPEQPPPQEQVPQQQLPQQPQAPPPPQCTPSAPNNITSSAGTVLGSSDGNGGSWEISAIGPPTTVTISDSGMVSCGLHHTMRAYLHSNHGTGFDCEPTSGSFVEAHITTFDPSDTIAVKVSYDSGC
jgi:hypothetical protein